MARKEYYVTYLHNVPFHIFLKETENEQHAISQAFEFLQSELNTNIEIIGAFPYNNGKVILSEKLPLETFLNVIKSAVGECKNAQVRFYASKRDEIGTCKAYITVYCDDKEIVTFTSNDC